MQKACAVLLLGVVILFCVSNSAAQVQPSRAAMEAELNQHEARLNDIIRVFRQTHNEGTPLPPEILQMQEAIRKERAALGVASPSVATTPNVGRTAGGSIPGNQDFTTKQQAVLNGIQNAGNTFQNIISQHLQEQERQAREQELEDQQLAFQAQQAQQVQMQQQIRVQQQQLQKLLEERRKEQIAAKPLFTEPLSSFYSDMPPARMPAKSSDVPPGWLEATIEPSAQTAVSADNKPNATAPKKPSERVGDILDLADNAATAEKFAADPKGEAVSWGMNGALKKVRDEVLSDKVKSDSTSAFVNSWREYGDEVIAEQPLKLGSINPLRKAAEKVKDAWRNLLNDELKGLEEFKP